jgi:phosphoenolpyruvate carboxylase
MNHRRAWDRRPLSSLAEPTLFPAISADALAATTNADGGGGGGDHLLWSDVRTMGAILGEFMSVHDGDEVLAKVETMRKMARESRQSSSLGEGGNSGRLDDMADFARGLTARELGIVSRAFSHFLGVANAAEAQQRVRKLRADLSREGNDGLLGALHERKGDSTAGAIRGLLDGGGDVSVDEIYASIVTQTAEIVLTAHPTQVNRRTLLEKHGRVQRILNEADGLRSTGTPYQRKLLDDSLRREIGSIWQTDELSRSKPSVQSEAERGTLVLETVMWEALPSFLRRLDATMRSTLGEDRGLPLTARPFKFASWMGGDRDGNPNVTSTVTREVCLTNRIKAARLLEADVRELTSLISGNPPRGRKSDAMDKIRERVGYESRAPFRSYLYPIATKLALTGKWAEQELHKLEKDEQVTTNICPDEVYLSKDELMDELLTVHRALCDTGNAVTADGRLADLIRKLSAFGLTFVPLDVRQESDRHAEVLDGVTRYLGLGSYAQWDEDTRVNWISQQLQSRRPLLRAGVWNDPGSERYFSENAREVLDTFGMIADQYEDSLGAYVISQCTSASDVLSVLLLQVDAGVKKPLRVVPLFETLDDLRGAASTMEQLFKLPVYIGSINGKQEVMVGYSDSAKDAGRLAASWAQYETQVQLAAVAKKYNIDQVYFHGKGGTVGRGANPNTFNGIVSHAPGTINGKYRVTEQGEMIDRNFGRPEIAERSLDLYTAALLAEKHTHRDLPKKEFKDMMDKLSEISCEAYRKIVFKEERFVPYFRTATPELELANLNIGSRPAKRKASGGVESLRAIPWIFAWTQTRLNLPTWLGVGEAISEVLAGKDAETLRKMYREFGAFRTTIDLVEMILSKSDSGIAQHYEKVLVTDPKAIELGGEIMKTFHATESAILDLSGHKTLSENDRLLQRLMAVRNPYVDVLNVLQVETLKRLRESQGSPEEGVLQDALLTTITGIANGMGNTG